MCSTQFFKVIARAQQCFLLKACRQPPTLKIISEILNNVMLSPYNLPVVNHQFLKLFPKYKEHCLQPLLSITKIGQQNWGGICPSIKWS